MKHKTILIIILTLTLLLGACSGIITETAPAVDNPTDNIVQSPPEVDDTTAEVPDNPAVEPGESPTPEQPAADPEVAKYWVEVQDPNHGFRFAVPCFWRVDFPGAIPNGNPNPERASYSVYNYPDDYASQFPRGAVPPENGIIKVNFSPIDLVFAQDVPNDISLEDYVDYEVSNSWSPERELVSVEETAINGNKALLVTDYNSKYETSGSYCLLRISPEFLLHIGETDMSDRYGSDDVQAMINSITLDPQAAVPMPVHTPGEPPVGVDASCMQ
jgi:hypothetical protein